MSDWATANLFFVYQAYGAAFLLLGVSALLLPRQSTLAFAKHLWLLGLFGLLHGTLEFVIGYQLMSDSPALATANALLTITSFMALFEFARRSLYHLLKKSWLQARVLLSVCVITGLSVIMLADSIITGLSLAGRYAFGVPGATMTGLAFLWVRNQPDQQSNRNHLGILAGTFLVYAALSSVATSIAASMPVWLPTHADFLRITGIPLPLARAVCAIVALISLLTLVSRHNRSNAKDLENILQGIDGLVYRCRNDQDWSLVYLNGNVEKLTGYSPAEFTGPRKLTLAELTLKEDRDRIWDQVQDTLARQDEFDLIYRMVTANGRTRWVQERGRGIFDDAGRLLYLQGHVFDADDLTTSRARLERAEELAGLGHWEFDPATGTGVWSRQMFRFFNLDPTQDAPDQATFVDLIHPEDRQIVTDALTDMAQRKSPVSKIYRSNPKHGPVRYFSPSWQCTFNKAGIPEYFSGTALDVTKQYLALEEIREAQKIQQELLTIAQKEQGRMAALLSAMSIGILFEDKHGLVEYVNPAFRRMWAIEEQHELIGQRTRAVMEHSTHRFARPDHASKHVLHVLDTHEISERFEVDLYDGRILTQLSYPVSDADGRIIGRLWIYEDVTHERQTAQQLVYLAEHDPLTGLHNRHRFQEHMEWMILSARRNNTRFALLYFDLDDFKYINDTFGHRAGDTVLVRAAGEVASLVRQGEMFARLGGDEFAILTEVAATETPIPLADRIRHAIASIPFRFRGSNLRLTTSIGITIFPEHGDNAEDLIAHADSAMYQAKNTGKNNWSVYDASKDLSQNMIARMNWVSRIAQALEQELLELHFQGVYRTSNRELSHLEALVRMRDPAKHDSLIMPGQFIPIAEKSGQILEIDRWVLRASIRTLARHPNLRALSVNISGRSFDEPTLPNSIHDLLKEYGVAPERLIIELTETAAVSEMQDAQRFIEALQQTGCIVCLDDFGTGFSTFAYLKYLGVEVLKIDGMFIRDLPNHKDNQAFVKAMIDVGRGLNKITVAEFVEDEATFNMLRDLGVDLAQGYYLDRPIADHPALSDAT